MKNMNKYIYALSMVVALPFSSMAQEELSSNVGDTIKGGFSLRQTQAISTISGKELMKNSSHNVSNTLYGLLPGLTSKQSTGWKDNPTFQIRGGGSINGTAPLLVVDGVPRPIEFLNTAEIENVQILKDAAATAIWGTRGANGVILVNTKRGEYNTHSIDVNYTHGISLPTNQPEFVDGYTFAKAKNEAFMYDGLGVAYDDIALAAFENGSNPDLYANTDWLNEGLRDYSVNNRLDISLHGGGKNLRYHTVIGYKNDYGIMNENLTDYTGRFNSQMKKYELTARINIDADLTPTTQMRLSMFGLLREDSAPNTDEEDLFGNLYHVPSAAFPVQTSSGMWGGNQIFKKNPIAQIADVGFYQTNLRTLQSDLYLNQDLSMVLEGLSAEVGISYGNNATFQERGSQTYAYEVNNLVLNSETGGFDVVPTVYGTDGALSVANGGVTNQYMRTILNGKVAYGQSFGAHTVNGMLKYEQESFLPLGRNGARSYQSVMFTGGYSYANKYMVDVVVNHAGNSLLSIGDKYRTYPAVSAAWVLSNEDFMESVSNIDFLKLRASWGLSGYDGGMAYDLDEQTWISGGGYVVGDNPTNAGGLIEGILPISNLTCEQSTKYNAGLDMQIFKNLSFTADFFIDQRRNSLITGDNVYSAILGVKVPKQNIGSMDSKGSELSLTWREERKSFNYYVGANFSYVDSEILENGEGYKPHDYLSKKGYGYGQQFGLEAIGYFNDEQDIKDNPTQMFSEVRPGDIKYKDQNNDGKIDDYDVIAIGNSGSVPAIYYGINLGFEYKGFGIDAVFQGLGKYSRMQNTQSVYWPLRNNNSNLSTWYMEDNVRWTEQTKETANLPRLTTLDNANNFRNSTQWLVDGSYFKLRNLNVYYNLPQKWVKSMKMENCQVYVRGNNLLSIDHVDYMNCEDFSINYPDMMQLFAGININF